MGEAGCEAGAAGGGVWADDEAGAAGAVSAAAGADGWDVKGIAGCPPSGAEGAAGVVAMDRLIREPPVLARCE